MSTKPIRFGVSCFSTGSRSAWRATAQRTEDLGYDVLLVPDHLNMAAPFPALVSAAEATTRIHVGTLVLNSGFYTPALLARDVAAAHELCDSRFELGLGAGWAVAEFEAAGLPFLPAVQRFEHLERTVDVIDECLREAGQHVPLMIGGRGDKMLTLAARQADIINFDDTPPKGKPRPDDVLGERINFVREAAGDRFPDIELGLVINLIHIAGEGELDLQLPRRLYPGLTDEQLLALPGVQHGSVEEIADSLQQLRITHGLTYFVVLNQGDHINTLSKIIHKID
jgi:probable F420-dependent oxidoreductase